MKNILHHFLIFTVFTIILSSCHPTGINGYEAVLYGECKMGDYSKVILYKVDTIGFHAVDSVKISKKGFFRFTIHSPEPGFYFIKNKQSASEIVVVHPADSVKAIFLPTGRVSFSGGKEAGNYQPISDEIGKAEMKIDSLSRVLELARIGNDYPNARKRADSLLDIEIANIKSEAQKYFLDHPDALSQLLVLNARLRQSTIFEELVDSKWYFYTDSTLMALYAGNSHVLKHHRKVQQLRRIIEAEEHAQASGMMNEIAPEISLPNVSGSIIQLSQNLGQQTIVYFWSPADPESKKVNSELKRLQEQTKNKDIMIFAVALDPFTERWKAAITLEKLWWNNVNDTLALGSTVAKTYQVSHLPLLVLLDSKGRIQQRFLSVNALIVQLNIEE